MNDLDDILKDDAPAASAPASAPAHQAAAAETMGDPAAAAAGAAAEGDAGAAPPDGEGAPPAPKDGGQVPLAALTAERKERQDWKERAIREEEQRKALERELETLRKGAAPAQQPPAAPTPAPDPLSDPEGWQQHQEARFFNERLNMSEQMLRQQHQDVDEKIAIFQEEAARNPTLAAQLRQQPHPWAWAYQQAGVIAARKEIGDDPAAFRARVEAELREKIQAELGAGQQQQPAAALPTLPPSLTTARSAAPRGAHPTTGQTPLADILSP